MQKTTQIKTNREELYKQIDEKTKVISHPTSVYKTTTFVCSGFPEKAFKEWKAVCMDAFNDIYWAKIWSDHIKAQAYDRIVAGGIQYIQENQPADKEEKEENDAPMVFGDGE